MATVGVKGLNKHE